jgi:hypothetical protein
MIYDRVQSTLESLAGTLDVVEGSLKQLSQGAQNANLIAEAATLQNMSVTPKMVAPVLRTNAASVPTQGPIQLLIAWARALLGNLRTNVSAPLVVQLNGLTNLPPSGDLTRCEDLLEGLNQAIADALSELEEAAQFPEGPGYNLSRLRSTADDIASYPVLTSDAGSYGTNGGSRGGGGTGVLSLKRSVDTAVREVLGRLPRYTDARAFTAALNATFDVRQEQGHTVAVWRPRGFTGQTELGGAVSGAQASLYARAQDALSAALPVLAGLTALRTDADIEEMDAARSVVEAEFRAVVDELGTPGGPKAARVDGLFDILLVQQVFGVNNVPVPGGMVGYLADVFGLQKGRVNTIAEEQVFSNFLLLRDYVQTLQASWASFNAQFAQRDLGTLLVLLSNALQVVAESVDEVEAALDSVFVGTAERSVARFDAGKGKRMLVSELLTWISSFAAAEAPELVQQGGRRSMGAIESTASRLNRLLETLLSAMLSDPGLPVGMRHPRVRHPVEELKTYLQQVVELADDVRRV